jgi:hypothetical protein
MHRTMSSSVEQTLEGEYGFSFLLKQKIKPKNKKIASSFTAPDFFLIFFLFFYVYEVFAKQKREKNYERSITYVGRLGVDGFWIRDYGGGSG